MTRTKELADPTSCINKANDDEPVFVLRAKDPLAPDVIRAWCAVAENEEIHSKLKIDEALIIADRMDEYREEHFK